MKTSVSMDSSDQKKTRLKLKKFLTRRPTYQAVRDKGYIKGTWTLPGHSHSSAWETLLLWEWQRVLGHLPLHRWKLEINVCLPIFRSGVWLQPDQSVPAGEHISAQLRQNVYRPCGEHRYERCTPALILFLIKLSLNHKALNRDVNTGGKTHWHSHSQWMRAISRSKLL